MMLDVMYLNFVVYLYSIILSFHTVPYFCEEGSKYAKHIPGLRR
jgi:hypothetical protein